MYLKYDHLIFWGIYRRSRDSIGVLNNSPLGAIELKPKRLFYDYKAKYTKSAKTAHIMPANLNKKKYNKVLNIAKQAHKALVVRGNEIWLQILTEICSIF